MISYASIDRIEDEFAICEIETIPVEESKPEDFNIKDTVMIAISLSQFPASSGEVREGDVWVVKHDNEKVKLVCYRDDKEKEKRLEILSQILNG